MSAPLSNPMAREVLQLEGALNFAGMSRLLSDTNDYIAQTSLPDCLTIDFSKVSEVDSSAVALMLHWRREAARLGKSLRYLHLPGNLRALAELYGVSGMIDCPSFQANCPEIPAAA